MAGECRLLVNLDVDDLARAVRFYTDVFALRVARSLGPDIVELLGAPVPLYLLEKPAGSAPFAGAAAQRDYARHWTPVHLDFVVESLDRLLERALASGATLEREVEEAPYGRIAYLADPFGHGICLVEFNERGYDALAD
jgi:lactoylglutathione lyase